MSRRSVERFGRTCARSAGRRSAGRCARDGAGRRSGAGRDQHQAAAAKTAPKSSSKATTASPRPPRRLPRHVAVLVRIGKEPITRAMVEQRLDELPEQYRAQYSTPEGRQQLLDRMVEEQVWLNEAHKKGVEARPEVKQQLEQQRRDLLIRTYVNEMMAKNPAPSDSEAMAYYDAHLSDYRSPATVTLRHIQIKTEAEAQARAAVRARSEAGLEDAGEEVLGRHADAQERRAARHGDARRRVRRRSAPSPRSPSRRSRSPRARSAARGRPTAAGSRAPGSRSTRRARDRSTR